MSTPATERLLIGAFAYFLEAGVTVDGCIVAAETVASPLAGKPDAAPTTNWSNNQLGNVMKAKFSTKTADETYLVPSQAGGYDEEVEKRVIADMLDVTSDKATEYFHRLAMGLSASIVNGTAQAPSAIRDRKLTGWLRVQARKQAGTDIFLLDWWCEMRLKDLPEYSDKVIQPQYEFRKLYSSLNSINFPA